METRLRLMKLPHHHDWTKLTYDDFPTTSQYRDWDSSLRALGLSKTCERDGAKIHEQMRKAIVVDRPLITISEAVWTFILTVSIYEFWTTISSYFGDNTDGYWALVREHRELGLTGTPTQPQLRIMVNAARLNEKRGTSTPTSTTPIPQSKDVWMAATLEKARHVINREASKTPEA